ncbi:MAG: hypothetical protein PHH85_09540 [Candidatus Methanoperedens sp.]|nr:hypothetical protein [Candidatus Methanoperedens sp.]
MVCFSRALIIMLVISALFSGAQAATVQGTIYSWSDFEIPLKNAIIEINTIPVQSRVATDGTYFFDSLAPGNYTIRAKYYRNNVLELAEEEDMQIVEKGGKYNIDLLLFPPTNPELEYLGDINLTGDLEIKGESDKTSNIILILIPVLILILISAGIAVHFRSKKEKNPAIVEVSSEPKIEQPAVVIKTPETPALPEDLNDLYNLIMKKGGRVTQKDIRGEMKCSEAKVSLMLDDLEDRGYIKKIKKGRSNIIIAESKK